VSLLGTVVPHAHLRISTFAGFFAVSMAIYAVALGWKDKWVRVYGCLAAGALAYSLGAFSIFHGWVYTLFPLADKARSASHAVYVFQFALFILAAHGIDRLFALDPEDTSAEKWISRAQKGLLLFGVAIWVVLLMRFANQQLNVEPGDRLMIGSLVAFTLAGLLQGFRRGFVPARSARVAFLLLMVFEMGVAHSMVLTHRSDPERPKYIEKVTDLHGVAAFLKKQPRPFRFAIRNEDGWGNLGGWEGLEMVDGQLASVSRDIYDFVAVDWFPRRSMLNRVYIVSRAQVNERHVEVYDDPNGWKVFRDPEVSPRVWVEHELTNITTAERSSSPLPPVETCEGDDEVEWLGQDLHSVKARVHLACAGYVVFADPFFPGWRARLDGERVPIYRAYTALRAVAVPAGEHSIEFLYRPMSVLAGAALTAMGLLGCAVLGVLIMRRRG
jgi:hypothetical protein